MTPQQPTVDRVKSAARQQAGSPRPAPVNLLPEDHSNAGVGGLDCVLKRSDIEMPPRK